MALLVHTASHRGGRRENEDALKGIETPHGTLLALADGLGGHEGGRAAADACLEAATQTFAATGWRPETLVVAAHEAISAHRRALGLSDNALRSTLALLWTQGATAQWAHVGDSRVYWFRDGRLRARTLDHSVAELVTRLGTQAPDPADRHQLTRALGTNLAAPPEISQLVTDLRPGDAFLLCSDGVWGLLSDAALTGTLANATTPAAWGALIELLIEGQVEVQHLNHHDNYSLITAMVRA